MAVKSAPAPAPEQGPAIEDAVVAAPTSSHFVGVNGITDGATHYGNGVHFVGTEALLAHYERTGGYDGNRQLYRPITEAEYRRLESDRLAAIQTPDLPDLPVPTPVDQVQENPFSSLPLPQGEAPIAARPNGQGQPVENGLAGSAGSA